MLEWGAGASPGNGSNRSYPHKWSFSPTASAAYMLANDNDAKILNLAKVHASFGIQHSDYVPVNGLWDYKGQTMPVNAAIEIPYDYKVVNAFKEGFRLDGPGAWVTMVTYGDKTSSVGVEVVEVSDETAVVYNLLGVCVRKAATIADALETLPKGLYIVNGKKIIK